MWNESSKDKIIRKQAAHWVVRMHGDREVTDADREAFNRWLETDKRHDEEFRRQNITVMLVRNLPLQGYKHTFPKSAAMSQRRTRWAIPAVAAAALLVVVTAAWFAVRSVSVAPPSYATHTGETRAVTFEDGSVAYLNTRTRLTWIGSKSERRVALIEGEALFDVKHDPTSPFSVVLDNSEIQVLGTRFNVYRKHDGETVVTVLEGVVQVRERARASDRTAWLRRLAANEQIVYRPAGLVQDVRKAPGTQTVKWREGALEAHNDPLLDVLEDLARYTDRRIVTRDPRLAELRLTGTLNIHDVRDALATIERAIPVTVTERGDSFALDYRSDSLQ